MSCFHFYPTEIETAILKLDVKKALGRDLISNALLENLTVLLPKCLSMNVSLIAAETVSRAKRKLSVIVPNFIVRFAMIILQH